MANVKAAMEYAQTFEREAMREKLDAALGDLDHMNLIQLQEVVVRHEQEIQELKRLITPMMEFKQEQLTTMGMEYAANFEKAEKLLEKKECYYSPEPAYKHVVYPPEPPKEWVGLTDFEIGSLTVFEGLHHIETPLLAEFIKAIEAKLKEKNT